MTDTFSLTDVGINQGIKRKEPPPRVEEVKKPAPPPPIEKIVITQREPTPPPAPAPMPPQRLFRSDSEDEGITNKEMEKKKYDWEKIKRKVHDPFVKPDTHYRDYPILPGYGFYKALINAKNIPLEVLDVNIPDTIINTDTQIMMYRDETTGRLTKKVEASFHDFEQRLVKTVKGFNLNDQGDSRDNTAMTGRDMPLAIQRIANSDNGLCQKKVLNYREIEGRRMYMVEPFSFYQKFVMPKGFRASILRLVFYTSNSTEQKGNYGYRMTNHSDIFDPDQTKSLMTKSTLSTDIENSFGITLVKGASLKEFEIMATKVVKFLERAYSVRILDCVFDFITDFEGINWLVNMKCLTIDPKSLENLEKAATRIKKDLDDLTCSVYCKLCMMIFKKDDASRTLTYKLMWELVQHLKKRGIQLNDIVVKHASTKPCRICDLCYMLVVSEHELIDIEQRIARAQNIPLGEGIYRVQSDTKPMHRPPLLADKLYQWRLMFYINYIGDLANHPKIGRYSNLHIQFKFGETKSVFPMKFLKSSKKPPKLAYKDDFTAMRKQQLQARQAASAAKLASPNYNLSGFSTMPNNTQSVRTLKKEEVANHLNVEKDTYYDLRLLRVFYIFSETTDIEKFLKETQMTIRITEGTDWNNFISEGAVYPLRTFRNQMKDGQRVENEVLCFFENEKYCVMHMTEGLVCDGVYRTENLNLYKYNNVYFPDDDYFNSNPFPPEWMEIFEESEKLIEDDLARENQIISYTPKCSVREIKKMVDFEMGHKKLSNVKSHTKMLWTQGANSNTTLKPQNMTTGTFETFHLVDQNKPKNHDLAAGTAPLMSRPFSAAELGGVRKKNVDYTNGKIRTIKDNGSTGRATTGKNRDVYMDILAKPPGEEENKELDNQIKQLQKYYTQENKDGDKNTSAQGHSQTNNENEVSKNIRKIILESGGNRSIEEEDILKKYERVSLEEQERKLRSAKEEQSKKAPKNEMPVLPHDILAMGGHDLSRDGNRKL